MVRDNHDSSHNMDLQCLCVLCFAMAHRCCGKRDAYSLDWENVRKGVHLIL